MLGNHCLKSLSKSEFLETTGAHAAHYSFDRAGYHFVVLDANFTKEGRSYACDNFVYSDANIPAWQLDWLRKDLDRTGLPTVVFVHQRLDAPAVNPFGINRAREVRRVLEQSGKVFAVFQGHSHFNAYRRIRGIHYVTLVAMVKGPTTGYNGFGTLALYPDGNGVLHGFGKQNSYFLARE